MKKAVIVGSMDSYNAEPTILLEAYVASGPPLSVVAVGSYLKAHGIPVEVIDIEMDFGIGLTPETRDIVHKRLIDYLRTQVDDIAWLGLSLHSNLSHGMYAGLSLIDDIHAALPDTPLVLGGYFATFTHEELFKKYPYVSAIVRGSGEIPALMISQRLARGEPLASAQIPNLAWIEEGKVRTTPITTPPLKDLPVLDFSLLRNVHAYDKIDLQTARGCLFKCDYCVESMMREFDSFPLDWFNRQLEHLESVTTTNLIQLWDPLFGVGKQRVLDIAKVISSRPRKYSWAFLGRADVLPLETLPVLRAAGMESIFFGVETASPSTLVRMKKINRPELADQYVKQALDAFTACTENDITPMVALMVGYPGDTEADNNTTMAFLDELRAIQERAPTQPGFLITAQVTKIYDNSVLDQKVDQQQFKDSILVKAGGAFGETYAASAELPIDVIRDYGIQMSMKSVPTENGMKRLRKYWGRLSSTLHDFLKAHPEVVDADGVFLPTRAVGMEGWWVHNAPGQ